MLVIFLNVPFKDKERAKSLGARWDPSQKKWYIPENVATDPFIEWLSSSTRTPIPELAKDVKSVAPLPQNSDIEVESSISLSQLLSRISEAVAKAIPNTEWIRAEISECHSRGTHFYLDLVEIDTHQQLLCKAKGIIFKNRMAALTAKFEAATGGFLRPGMKVLLQVKANFNVMHGLSLSVEDIDPNYTLGDMAAKLAKIREQLKSEGIYNKNKQLSSPKDFTRIAVISPDMAAGLGDFKREAAKLEILHLCYFHYYTAQFQGTLAAEQIYSAIETVNEDHKELSFDTLVILRGGGAVIDLAWLNEYVLAKQICNCPFVVFTGIGHERDNTILDEVAFLRFDTPSKVIAYIFNRITENAGLAIQHANEIRTESIRLWSTMQHRIFEQFTTITRKAERDTQQIQRLMEQWYHQGFQQAKSALKMIEISLINEFERLRENSHVSIHSLNINLKQHWQYLQGSCPEQIIQAENEITRSWQQLRDLAYEMQDHTKQILIDIIEVLYQDSAKVRHQVEKALAELMGNIIGLGPSGTLKRGYALVRDPIDNKMITSKVDTETLSLLEIQFHDGNVNVRPI